jgi:hypothetical protein
MLTDGAEHQKAPSTTAGEDGSGEFISCAGTVGINTTNPRSGAACYSCAPSAANYWQKPTLLVALANSYFLRFAFRFDATPSQACTIAGLHNGTAFCFQVHLNTSKQLGLLDTSGALIGSRTSALTVNNWYVVEVSWQQKASGNGIVAWRIADTVTNLLTDVITLANADINNTVADRMRIGHITAGETAMTVLLDDIAINDTSTSDQNSWCDWRGKILHALPVSDNSVGTGWLTAAGGSTNLFNDVDNVPPTGVAATPTTGQTQIKNADATAGQLNYVANVQSYTTVGVPSGATIAWVRSGWRCAGSSITGTNNALLTLLSNPADAGASTFTDGFDPVASAESAGAGSNTWRTGLTPYNYSPSVTRGTQPTIRLGKNSASTRVAMADQAWVQIEYVPTNVDATAATLKWDLPAAVNASADSLLWDLRTAVNSAAESLLWDLRSQVDSAAESLLWDLRSLVNAAADSLLWDLRGAVGQTLTLDWDLGEAINGLTSMLKWDLAAEVDQTQTFLWDMIAQVNADAERLLWDLPIPVNSLAESFVWDIPGVANADPLRILWDLRGAVSNPATFQWGLASTLDAEALTLLWRLWGFEHRTRPFMTSALDLESAIHLRRT